MKKEKTKITQELCRKVQIMLAGAKAKEVAGLLGISETTISRIKAAGFSAEQYEKNTAARKAEEKKPEVVLKPFPMDQPPADEQCAGQISMEELQKEEWENKPINEWTDKDMKDFCSRAWEEKKKENKMMRFLAGKFDSRESTEALWAATVSAKLDMVIDYLGQILRKMDR